MKQKTTPARTKSQSQGDKFKAMAKELGADGDEKKLDKALKKLARRKTSLRSK